MLLRKQRLTEIDKIRQKNEKWKNDVAKQMLQKQLQKKNKQMRQQQELLKQEQKIRKYQELIESRIKQGCGVIKKGKEERERESRSMVRGGMGSKREIRERKEESYKSQNNSKKRLESNSEEDIPLFPELQTQKNIPQKQEAGSYKTPKQNQPSNSNPITHQPKHPIKQQSIPNIAQSPIGKKRRKSTAHRRQDTIQSLNIPDRTHSLQLTRLQQQNKKLKQQLQKKNETLENLLKLIKVQNTAPIEEQVEKVREEGLRESKEIGFTEYVKMDSERQKRSPVRVLFPSLNFKDAPIIMRFNLKAAKKANSAETAQFIQDYQQNN